MMILGKKLGQTSFLDSKGKRVCATVLDYKGCTVVGNRTNDKDGYIANIIGFLKPKKLNKPQQQDFIKKNIDPKEIESYWNKRIIGEGTYDLANYAQSVKNTNIEFPKNLVFLHIFKDSPFNTIDRDRIFSDYYEWVVETLKILKERNIGTRVMYGPINKQIAYNVEGEYKISNMVGKKGLWLPSSTQLTNDELKYICSKIVEFYN